MKQLKIPVIYALVIMISVTGCIFDLVNTVQGNGNVVTDKRHTEPFTRLKAGAGLKVYITQGEEESIKVIADENLMEVIVTECSDGTLKVYAKANIRNAKSKEVHIVYSDMDVLSVSSACHLKGENKMVTDEIEINTSNGGDLELEIDAQMIDMNVSSGGKAWLKGNTEKLVADASSGGILRARELITQDANVSASSGGNARIYIEGKADLRASSGGNIRYSGKASIKNISSSSGGNIHRD